MKKLLVPSEQRRCDECVPAGQNVFLGPTTHLPRPDCYVEVSLFTFDSHISSRRRIY